MTYFRHEAGGPIAAGDQWNITMHSSALVAIDPVQQAWVTAFGAIWLAMEAHYAGTQGCTRIATYELDPSTGKNVNVRETAAELVGTNVASAEPPPDTTFTVGLRTTTPTRGGRGRFYMPGLVVASLTGTGLWDQAISGPIATAIASALRTMQTTSSPVIYHRASRTGTNVSTVTVGNVPNSQRRRTNKVLVAYSTVPI